MNPIVHHKAVSDGGIVGTSSVSGDSAFMTDSEIEKVVPATREIAVGGADGSLVKGNKPGNSGGSDESCSRYVLAVVSKKDVPATGKDSFVIDIRPHGSPGVSFEGEKMCRICHLSSELVPDTNASKIAGKGNCAASFGAELILLGCGCKDELGMAHRHCAEAWFKLKGNRFCEICCETAKNVYGAGDNRFMEEWSDRGGIDSTSISSSERGGGCCRRQPFCNFLMACLVMAFVLPWFFRVNLF